MKIMLLAPGVSIHSKRFIHMLLDSGQDVVLIDSYNPLPQGAKHYRFIHYPGMFGLERLGLRIVNRWIGPRLIALQLRLIWKMVKPDLVHVHWVDNRAHHCTLSGIRPLILTAWGSDINNLFSSEWQDQEYKDRLAEAVKRADHITADSPEVISRCEILAGRKISSSLYYFGVDMGRFSPSNQNIIDAYKGKLNISVNARVILSARALRPLMGHHWILEAFAKIARRSDYLDTLLILKRYLPFDDDYEERLKIRIQDLRLDDRVIWLNPPPDEEMPLLYGVADIVVNFPERDGFPVTFFEAAACRRPIVSSDLPAYAGIVTKDECWLVPPGDVEALANRLVSSLSADKEEICKRVDQAYSTVKTHGEQVTCFSVMATLYLSLSRKQSQF